MELGSIIKFLENKTILVTGATGFVGKTFVEKILRVQPNVKKLFILIRAADTESATQRLHNEVIGKEVFKVVKEKWGDSLNSFISEKVSVVVGDISCEDLGVKEFSVREEMRREIDIIINSAARTKFDERYEVSLHTNTLGPKHILSFAKKCTKMKMFVHVSTAYVSGERAGLVLEEPFRMGETLNGNSGLDIEAEVKLAKERLKQLQEKGATEETITSEMKDFGLERARLYGWPNTYVFTKAMGEMLLGHLKEENMPLVILRPTTITGTYKEPIPGWTEGLRSADALALGYGKGRLTCFLGDPESIYDAIPADMVINSMIVAIVANWNQPCEMIYQVGSSVRNPFKGGRMVDLGYRYFTKNPWIGKDGKPVKVPRFTVLTTMASFHRYMAIRYLLLLKVLLVLSIFSKYFRAIYTDFDRKIKYAMKLIDIYRPYLFFKGIYDDMNTEKLRMAAREGGVEEDIFFFDPKCIDWDNYILNIHLPGLVNYVFR